MIYYYDYLKPTKKEDGGCMNLLNDQMAINALDSVCPYGKLLREKIANLYTVDAAGNIRILWEHKSVR